MIRVRWPVIAFAIGSAIYWQTVSPSLIVMIAMLTANEISLPVMFGANFVAMALYAVIALLFCHWLMRRVQRQILERHRPHVQEDPGRQSR